jgi:L-fuculose-phosphate aldolase
MTNNIISPGHDKSEREHRSDLCVVGRWMYERGLNVACDGNLSVRLNDGRILTTPTCMNKGMMEP